MKKGEITVFLSLIFILLLSFVAGIIESASIQVSKNHKRADMDSAMESVFAEYQRELLEDYEIFGLEGTYETGNFDYENVISRISYYGCGEAQHDIEGVRLLTDEGGKAFYQQILFYMEQQYGLTQLGEYTSEVESWNQQKDKATEYQKEDMDIKEEMNTSLNEVGESLPSEENPIENISNIKKSNLLGLVVPNPEQLSQKQIDINNLPSRRTLQKGYGEISQKEVSGVLGKVGISEYIMEKFSDFSDGKENGGMNYQIEYLLAGKGSEQENLEEVVNKLIWLRFANNYIHLFSDEVKKAEASAMAISMCTLLTVPGISEIVKQAILFAWAYGESVMDVRTLLEGNKVVLFKTAETWQLSLEGLLTLGTSENNSSGANMEGGLEYKEYLRALLYLADTDSLIMRSMDVIEDDLRVGKGLEFFRMDYCISALNIRSSYKLRRGIRYDFSTEMQYK